MPIILIPIPNNIIPIPIPIPIKRILSPPALPRHGHNRHYSATSFHQDCRQLHDPHPQPHIFIISVVIVVLLIFFILVVIFIVIDMFNINIPLPLNTIWYENLHKLCHHVCQTLYPIMLQKVLFEIPVVSFHTIVCETCHILHIWASKSPYPSLKETIILQIGRLAKIRSKWITVCLQIGLFVFN